MGSVADRAKSGAKGTTRFRGAENDSFEPNLPIWKGAANVVYWVGDVPATQNSFLRDLTRSAKKSTNSLTLAVFLKSR